MNDQNDLGILDVTPKGAGFIRRRGNGYLPGSGDIHVGRRLIQQHGLRTGDLLAGETAKAKGRGKSRSLTKVASVNGRPPGEVNGRPRFSELRAIHPNEQLELDCGRRPPRAGRPWCCRRWRRESRRTGPMPRC